jgi:hypothetical protein
VRQVSRPSLDSFVRATAHFPCFLAVTGAADDYGVHLLAGRIRDASSGEIIVFLLSLYACKTAKLYV